MERDDDRHSSQIESDVRGICGDDTRCIHNTPKHPSPLQTAFLASLSSSENDIACTAPEHMLRESIRIGTQIQPEGIRGNLLPSPQVKTNSTRPKKSRFVSHKRTTSTTEFGRFFRRQPRTVHPISPLCGLWLLVYAAALSGVTILWPF